MKWAAILTVIAATAFLVTGDDSLCPPGFVDFGDNPLEPNCLAFVLSAGTWENYEYWCSRMDANVSKIEGALHNKVYSYILETPGLAGHCFWIGGTDWDYEGRWVWDSDGTEVEMGTPHWDPCTADPNGYIYENYMCLCPDDYFYRDCKDDDTMYGICQI